MEEEADEEGGKDDEDWGMQPDVHNGKLTGGGDTGVMTGGAESLDAGK